MTISNSLFWRLGGNGIILSDAARGCSIRYNEFGHLGENAIVSVGTAVLNDGTKPTYPRGNLIEANHVHDIGLWTKQVAGYTQFLTARATVRANVVSAHAICCLWFLGCPCWTDCVCGQQIYNTPRAGLNL